MRPLVYSVKKFEQNTVEEQEHIEAIMINPSPDIVSLVQRCLCKLIN